MSPRLYTFMYVDKCVTPFFLNWRENMYRVPRRIPFGFVILLSATHINKNTLQFTVKINRDHYPTSLYFSSFFQVT